MMDRIRPWLPRGQAKRGRCSDVPKVVLASAGWCWQWSFMPVFKIAAAAATATYRHAESIFELFLLQ
jgi:hypothetical protein